MQLFDRPCNISSSETLHEKPADEGIPDLESVRDESSKTTGDDLVESDGAFER
jgi:hypothetical protein